MDTFTEAFATYLCLFIQTKGLVTHHKKLWIHKDKQLQMQTNMYYSTYHNQEQSHSSIEN